jgi:NAD(P)-dependent dehydrogenase (short-subunit alcohol dehydrogenase family)
MASKRIALILGAGSNNGNSLARKFSADGYTVAISSRRVENGTSPEGYITIKGDYAEKDVIPSIFERLKSVAGIPSVVIYNGKLKTMTATSNIYIMVLLLILTYLAGMLTPPSPPDDVLSIPVTAVEKDLWVNTLSPLTAAQQAIKGFKELPEGGNKIFIYTGNKLNSSVIPVGAYFTLGIGKAASAFWVGSADLNYSKNGYR